MNLRFQEPVTMSRPCGTVTVAQSQDESGGSENPLGVPNTYLYAAGGATLLLFLLVIVASA